MSTHVFRKVWIAAPILLAVAAAVLIAVAGTAGADGADPVASPASMAIPF